MKIIYIASVDKIRSVGVYHKIQAQIGVLQKSGADAQLAILPRTIDKVFFDKLLYLKSHWDTLRIGEDVDVLYIRYARADYGMLRFLKKFKKGRADRRVIVEIASYPYEGECSAADALITFKDRVFRRFLKLYVDRVATFSRGKEIFGIKTLHIRNGVDVSKIPVKSQFQDNDGEINLIAVANMQFWQGYDRIIRGLGNYYRQTGEKRTVRLHLVGTGSELVKYHKLVEKYNLKQYVLFYGNQVGENLDSIYEKCDMGIVTLGGHRKGTHYTSALKSKEYAVRGIPMIGSCRIDVFPEKQYPYVKYFSEDNCPIDIYEVIHFYDIVYPTGKSRKEIAWDIRRRAEKRCNMERSFQPVVSWLWNEQMERERQG